MRCIEELGLLKFLANFISDLIKAVENESDRLVFAILMLILVSALISSLIDNIPFTTAMIPIIIQLSEQADVSLKRVNIFNIRIVKVFIFKASSSTISLRVIFYLSIYEYNDILSFCFSKDWHSGLV